MKKLNDLLIEKLTELLKKTEKSKRNRTEIRVDALDSLIALASLNKKLFDSLWIIRDRANDSTRKRTEIRQSKIEWFLGLIIIEGVTETPKKVVAKLIEHVLNQCKECGDLVLTPIMKPVKYVNAVINKVGVDFIQVDKLPYHKVWKTIGRNYCIACLTIHFDKSTMPKLVDRSIDRIFDAHRQALKTLGYENRIKRMPIRRPTIKISHLGLQSKDGKHGLYNHTYFGTITLYLKKMQGIDAIYQTFIHEITHHFMRFTSLTGIDNHSSHGDIFKALLKETTKVLGFQYQNDANLTYIAKMSPITDPLAKVSEILGY